jgi:aspartokinase
LKKHYHVETILVKDISVRSADPKIVPKEQTSYIASLSYNEANKASLMGMKIVQGSAVSMARQFTQPIQIVPINSPEESTLISSKNSSQEIVKCVTGKSGCAILSINNEKSSSLSNALRVWEGRDDFIELGVETLETGMRIRDFLFLNSDFLKKNEDRLKRFDTSLTIEYGVGVVTIIGDQMATASGIASLAISAIPNINIKRGIFAPHTSQIILVVDEKNVTKSVQDIHTKRDAMNLG